MDVTELAKKLKTKAPAMVYLVLGTQQVLQEAALTAFMSLIPEDQRVMNIGRYDMEVTPLASALADAVSAPFFGERRLVVVNKPYFLTNEKRGGKIEHDLAALTKYLQHPEPTTTLVFSAPYEKLDGRKKLVKELKKVAVNVSAAPLDERSARQQVESGLHQDGFTIDDAALETLVQRTNADYGLMVANVAKLKILAYQNKQITTQMVEELVPQSLDDNVFDLVTAVLRRDQPRSLALYQQLLASQKQPLQINAVLVSQFRLLIQLKILVKHGLSQGSIASKLNVHPYRVKLGLRTVRQFSLERLANAYLGLVKIERTLKTTQRDPELLFQLFMLQYTRQN